MDVNLLFLLSSLQIIFGANKDGVLYMWDLRGGKASAAFHSHKEVNWHHHFSLQFIEC